jgi:hypothetical protein
VSTFVTAPNRVARFRARVGPSLIQNGYSVCVGVQNSAPRQRDFALEGGDGMQVWIQHADYSQEEFDLDLRSTLNKLDGVDWPAELAREQQLAKSGADSCPPGLGIVHPTDRILHICPAPSGAQVHFHFPHKALGFLKRQKSITLEGVRQEQIERCVQAFFDAEWEFLEGQE